LHLQIGDEPNAPEWVLGLGGRFIATFEYSEELSAEGGKHLVDLLSNYGHEPDWTVTLGLNQANGSIDERQVLMTKINRDLTRYQGRKK
jgi:hypothetical protein